VEQAQKAVDEIEHDRGTDKVKRAPADQFREAGPDRRGGLDHEQIDLGEKQGDQAGHDHGSAPILVEPRQYQVQDPHDQDNSPPVADRFLRLGRQMPAAEI
jgi:hypothetical protein